MFIICFFFCDFIIVFKLFAHLVLDALHCQSEKDFSGLRVGLSIASWNLVSVLVCWDCYSKMPWNGWLQNNISLFLTVLKAGKRKIKVLVDSMTGEGLAFLFLGGRENRASLSLLNHTLIPFQKASFQYHHQNG